MDLNLYARVIWRFRVLVIGGFLLAIALTFLSMVRVSTQSPHFAYRKPVKFSSTTILFASQAGYPYRSSPFAAVDPGTFAQIASNFATGDEVRSVLKLHGGLNGKIEAIAENDGSGHALPFVDVTGIANSSRGAIALANRAAAALQRYVVNQQSAAGIDPSRRMGLSVVSEANKAVVSTPRAKALPVLVFVLIMALTIGTAFVLENLRPSARTRALVEPSTEASDVRLSA